MRDITEKQSTLRSADAQAIVYCTEATLDLIREKKIPKGDVFEFARAAGLLGAKNTAHLIPHCHPIGIDAMHFEFEVLTHENYTQHTGLASFRPGIVVTAHAKCIGRTGIEIEAITGVSVAALTIYDILKPVDTKLEISHIKVLGKTGGKSDRRQPGEAMTCAVLVCSDSTFHGRRVDASGGVIRQMLAEHGATVAAFAVVNDEKPAIQAHLRQWVEQGMAFVFTTGGTGLGPRDVTVEAVEELLEKRADGITEAMRSHGQLRTPFAMLSRAVAGTIGRTVVITLPGNVKGVRECLDAILPAVFHTRKIVNGGGHDE
jgi:cyclic pyranopterin monophosphate synthase